MTRLKVGVIGVGRMGNLHLQKFLQLPEADVVGIYETDAARAHEISTRYSVRAFAHLDDLFFESDAVCISSPTVTHYPISKLALEAGVHCLVEKPIAETPEEGEALAALAEAKGILLQVGFLERFRFEALAKGCAVRPPRFLESHRLTTNPGRESHKIDVVSDLMIHDLDLALALVGEEPSRISGIGGSVLTPHCDLANVRLEFPGGAVANLNASRISPKPVRRFRVFSLEACTAIDFLSNRTEASYRNASHGIEVRRSELPGLDALQAQNRAFLTAVAQNTPPLVSARDGVSALRCSERIRESIARRAAWGPSDRPPLESSL